MIAMALGAALFWGKTSAQNTYKVVADFGTYEGNTVFGRFAPRHGWRFVQHSRVQGGASNQGTIFKIDPFGVLSTLHAFNGTDGTNPYDGLVRGPDGKLYGTTRNGGAHNLGTVYRVTPAGVFSSLLFISAIMTSPPGRTWMDTSLSASSFSGSTDICMALPSEEDHTSTARFTGSRRRARSPFSTASVVCSTGNSSAASLPAQVLVQGPDGLLYGTTTAGGGALGTDLSNRSGDSRCYCRIARHRRSESGNGRF